MKYRFIVSLMTMIFLPLTVCPAESVKLTDGAAPDSKVSGEPTKATAVKPLFSGNSATGLYPSLYEQSLADALWKAADKAGSFAKSVSHGIGDYMRDRQMEKYREDLVQKFYAHLEQALRPFAMSLSERKEITGRIEKLYIEDGDTNQYKLDTVNFSELPFLVRKEYGDMRLSRTTDGEVETYTIDGKIRTRWSYRKGALQGPTVIYDENGGILYIDIYDHGKKVSRKKYTSDGKLEFEQKYDYELANESPQTAPQLAENLKGGNLGEANDVRAYSTAVLEEQSNIAPDHQNDEEDVAVSIPVTVH